MKQLYCPLCRTAIESSEYTDLGVECRLCHFSWLPLSAPASTYFHENYAGRFGSIAVHSGFITIEQLKEALKEQNQTEKSLGQILLSLKYLDEEQLDSILLLQKQIPRYKNFMQVATVETEKFQEQTQVCHNSSEGELEKTVTMRNEKDWENLNPSVRPLMDTDPLAPHPLFEKGKISHYSILGELGRGGMGVVFLVKEEKTKQEYALKVLSATEKENKTSRKRFEREVQTILQLKHPNIVEVVDYGIEEEYPYLVMERIRGKTLKEFVEEKKFFLSAADLENIFTQLLSALFYAHEHHVIHRDLKPSNFMWNEQGLLKLMDFGLSKKLEQPGEKGLEAALTKQGVSLGTPMYMSPEQIMGDVKKIDHRTDLYAVGIMLYLFLTGEFPFERNSVRSYVHHILNTPVPVPIRKNKEIDSKWEEVCLKALAKDPKDRFSSAQEMMQVLFSNEIGIKPKKKFFSFLKNLLLLTGAGFYFYFFKK